MRAAGLIAAAGFSASQAEARREAHLRSQARAMLIIGASREAGKINRPAIVVDDGQPCILVHRIPGRDDRRLVTLWSSRDRPLAIAVDPMRSDLITPPVLVEHVFDGHAAEIGDAIARAAAVPAHMREGD